MTRRRCAALGIGAVAVLARAEARAQSLVERVDDDACEQAATYDTDDNSAPAQHARRACRLQRFDQRLASERQARIVAAEKKRVEATQAWMEAEEPARVVRPVALGLFVGSGLASYGLDLSWTVLRSISVNGWIGTRHIDWSDTVSSGNTTSYSRTSYGIGGRWYLAERTISPYVGTGFATTSASMQASFYNPMDGSVNFLTGSARAHVVSGSAGLALAYQRLRIDLEYTYAYAFYTQANKDDATKTPDDDLRRVWQDSIDSASSGIRFQVGYAF